MKEKKGIFNSLLERIEIICNSQIEKLVKIYKICELLKKKVSYYDWVGLYLVDKSKKDELILSQFFGEPTKYVRIPFGQGICGQVAEKKETCIIQDVTKETNYLSCSVKVKSEIVVPIFKNGIVIGEIDIDSHSISPFTQEDNKFLKNVSDLVAKLM